MFNFMVTGDGGLTTAGYAIAIIAGIVLFLAAIYFAGKHSAKQKLTTTVSVLFSRTSRAWKTKWDVSW